MIKKLDETIAHVDRVLRQLRNRNITTAKKKRAR